MTMNLDINVIRGLMTVVWMLMFLGIVWWAFHPRSRQRFDEAANLPFEGDEQNPKNAPQLNQRGREM